MKFRRMFAVLAMAIVGLTLGGCSHIRQPAGGGIMSGVHGDAWYVRNDRILVFLISSRVYYCDGEGTCTKARLE